VTRVSPRLPRLAIWLLRVLPLGDRRSDAETDLGELFEARLRERGRRYATRRLTLDIISLCRPSRSRGQMLRDMRFGLRLFRKHPAAVGITAAGLALAIGAVTSVYSLLNAMILRPYKMHDPWSVVSIPRPGHTASWAPWPYADYLHFAREARLSDVVASLTDFARFGAAPDDDGTSRLRVMFVSGGYLQTLGGRAAIGRSLDRSDDAPGAPAVVVASHYFWKTKLNGDPSVIGRPIWLNGSPVVVVGVAQQAFAGPVDVPPSLWAPLASVDDVYAVPELGPTSRTFVEMKARLRPGVSMLAAESELAALFARGSPAPPSAAEDPRRRVRLFSAASPSSGGEADEAYLTVFAILGTIGLILALACANAANLMLAGAVTRVREIGVRLALGATRKRLVRQLLAESLLLGLMAGGLGLLFAWWFVPLLAWALSLPPDVDVSPDGRVLTFALAIAVVCGLAAGIAPARYGARGDLLTALKAQSTPGGHARRSSAVRMSFVGFQAAVSLVLLVAAALLTRTALRITQADPGFDADRLLAVSAAVPRSNFDESAYFQSALEALRAVPTVERVSLSQYQPFGPSVERDRMTIDGRSYELYSSRVDAAYFLTMGLRIVRGRAFTPEEVAAGAPVALVSESVVRDFLGGGEAIGRSVATLPSEGTRQPAATIIGVVGDALLGRLRSERYGMIYWPLGQKRPNPPVIVVRTQRPAAVAHAVETALARMNPRVRPTATAIDERLSEYFREKRTMAVLAIVAGSLALMLAVLGVYGVTAFVVSQSTQEVGIRMAIGASRADILRLVVGRSLRPVGFGLAVGLAVALLSSRVIASMLAGIGPRDPVAIGLAVAVLVASALLSVIAPARRAAATDPANILRT
jgi:putative ABC transport system permease protein